MTCQRTQSLNLAGGGEPAPHTSAGIPPPSFDGIGAMRSPKDKDFQRPYQKMVARVQPVHETRQPGEALGGRSAFEGERLAQTGQQGTNEPFPLEEDQH